MSSVPYLAWLAALGYIPFERVCRPSGTDYNRTFERDITEDIPRSNPRPANIPCEPIRGKSI